jgi:hypothetical protein
MLRKKPPHKDQVQRLIPITFYIYIYISRCTVPKARGHGTICDLCRFNLQSGPRMVQRAQEEREEGDGNHWGSYWKGNPVQDRVGLPILPPLIKLPCLKLAA